MAVSCSAWSLRLRYNWWGSTLEAQRRASSIRWYSGNVSGLFFTVSGRDVDSVLPQVHRLVKNLACANEPVGWHPAVVQERGAVGGEKQPSLMIMIPGQMISAPHHHTTPQHNQTHSRQRQALDLELLSGYSFTLWLEIRKASAFDLSVYES